MHRVPHPKISANAVIILCVVGLWPVGHTAICKDLRTFQDALGRSVQIPYPPARIVSLAPDVTETLFALGLDREIVGVSRFSNYPVQAEEKPDVGPYVNINIETVIHLNPDVIVGTGAGNSRTQVERLERLGFPVFVVYPKNLDDILETILLIAHVVGRNEQGKHIVRNMERRIARVYRLTREHRRPLVFVQIGQDPIFTVSKGSFADDLIWRAGGENVAKDEDVPYPSYSLEEILLRAPEVIVISSMVAGEDRSGHVRFWKRWTVVPAVKNNRIYTIDSDLIDRPSPRIVDGLESLARMIHPEVFVD